jgi:hypothetical protein
VRPVERVVARGEPSRWLTPGLDADSLRLRLAAGERTVLDTVLRSAPGDTLQAPALPPGVFRYQARAYGPERQLDGTGELTVEAWAPELARPRTAAPALRPAERLAGEDQPPTASSTRPLHVSPLPYVLLVLLLAAEWILRRRWGLR